MYTYPAYWQYVFHKRTIRTIHTRSCVLSLFFPSFPYGHIAGMYVHVCMKVGCSTRRQLRPSSLPRQSFHHSGHQKMDSCVRLQNFRTFLSSSSSTHKCIKARTDTHTHTHMAKHTRKRQTILLDGSGPSTPPHYQTIINRDSLEWTRLNTTTAISTPKSSIPLSFPSSFYSHLISNLHMLCVDHFLSLFSFFSSPRKSFMLVWSVILL